jgi:hypothetical protein
MIAAAISGSARKAVGRVAASIRSSREDFWQLCRNEGLSQSTPADGARARRARGRRIGEMNAYRASCIGSGT